MGTAIAHTGQCSVKGLDLEWLQEGQVWTMRCAGRLNLGEGRVRFDKFVDFIHENRNALIVDLRNLRGVDSGGLGSLVRATVLLKDRLRFINLSNRLDSMLALCKLLTVIPISSSESEARKEILGKVISA